MYVAGGVDHAADFLGLVNVAVVFVGQTAVGFVVFGADGAHLELVAGHQSCGTVGSGIGQGGGIKMEVVLGI